MPTQMTSSEELSRQIYNAISLVNLTDSIDVGVKNVLQILHSQKERVIEMIKTLPCHSEQPQGGSGGGGRQYIYLDDLKNKIEEGL